MSADTSATPPGQREAAAILGFIEANLADDEQLAQVYLARREAQGIDREKWAYRLVLADCAVKRRILAAHRDAQSRWVYYQRDGEEPFVSEARASLEALDAVLRVLVLSYADRPGYRGEWLPGGAG